MIFALLPPLLEMISDGGPGKFGDPETGFTMVITGFIFWPIAVITLLIGLKRLLSDNNTDIRTTSGSSQITPPENSATIESWSMDDIDKQK